VTELFEQSPFDPTKERRVVIIADWLPPDFGAVGQYMQMRAQKLAEQGHEVTLVGLSTGAGSETHQGRGKGSLTEIRLSARPVPRGSLFGRMLWTIATNIRLILAGFRPLRAADGILFTGSPPFLIHLLVPLKLLWRGRLIYRITDFHPECLIVARDRPSRALSLLLGLTNFWRRRVDGFEVLGEAPECDGRSGRPHCPGAGRLPGDLCPGRSGRAAACRPRREVRVALFRQLWRRP
jgi:hypothetical protein